MIASGFALLAMTPAAQQSASSNNGALSTPQAVNHPALTAPTSSQYSVASKDLNRSKGLFRNGFYSHLRSFSTNSKPSKNFTPLLVHPPRAVYNSILLLSSSNGFYTFSNGYIISKNRTLVIKFGSQFVGIIKCSNSYKLIYEDKSVKHVYVLGEVDGTLYGISNSTGSISVKLVPRNSSVSDLAWFLTAYGSEQAGVFNDLITCGTNCGSSGSSDQTYVGSVDRSVDFPYTPDTAEFNTSIMIEYDSTSIINGLLTQYCDYPKIITSDFWWVPDASFVMGTIIFNDPANTYTGIMFELTGSGSDISSIAYPMPSAGQDTTLTIVVYAEWYGTNSYGSEYYYIPNASYSLTIPQLTG